MLALELNNLPLKFPFFDRFDSGGSKVGATVPGKERRLVAVARPIDPTTAWSLTARYTCKKSTDPTELLNIKHGELTSIQRAQEVGFVWNMKASMMSRSSSPCLVCRLFTRQWGGTLASTVLLIMN